MNKFISLLVVVAVVLVSCLPEVKKKEILDEKEIKYRSLKDEVRVFDSLPMVSVKYLDSIKEWKGYFRVKESLKLLKKTSANEVLSSAEVLVKDITAMKDSVPTLALKQKGMYAKMNGLYNQALRLQEMRDISAITIEEVTHQTEGLFTLFNMINNKVNAIYDQIDFENKMIEDDFVFSLKDTIF